MMILCGHSHLTGLSATGRMGSGRSCRPRCRLASYRHPPPPYHCHHCWQPPVPSTHSVWPWPHPSRLIIVVFIAILGCRFLTAILGVVLVVLIILGLPVHLRPAPSVPHQFLAGVSIPERGSKLGKAGRQAGRSMLQWLGTTLAQDGAHRLQHVAASYLQAVHD